MNLRFSVLLVLHLVGGLGVSAARIDTLEVFSDSMGKTLRNIVILPDEYMENGEQLPVLYLLHGAYGDFTDWTSKAPHVIQFADLHNMIIVCPDGDTTSWYFDSPIDEKMRYETYLSNELISAVEKDYNTIEDRRGRAITGLSMGGHGAFYLAFRHQEIWGAAGSMSGGLDIRPFPANWGISKRLGEYAENKENWETNTVINMVHLLEGERTKLIFDCGTQDFFIDVNRRFHEKLLERNIPHDYIERTGTHNWDYWSNAVGYQMQFFGKYFEG